MSRPPASGPDVDGAPRPSRLFPALLSDGLNEFSNIEFDPESTEHVSWTQCFGELTTGASNCLAFKGFTRTVHVLAPGVEWTCTTCTAKPAAARKTCPSRSSASRSLRPTSTNTPPVAIILGGHTKLHTDQEFAGGIWQTFREATGIVDVCDTLDCGTDDHDIDKLAYRNSDALQIEPLTHRFEREKFTHDGGKPLSDHEALAVRFRWTHE